MPLRRSFRNASTTLCRDKKFMLQVLELAPSLIKMVAPRLRNDFDLCLLAFSGEQRAVETEVNRRRRLRSGGDSSEYTYVQEFRSKVSRSLSAHATFSTIVLPGISQNPDSGCTLASLNQGAATSRSYKKRMADFLDVPTGKRLRFHRQADRNLDAVLSGIANQSDEVSSDEHSSESSDEDDDSR